MTEPAPAKPDQKRIAAMVVLALVLIGVAVASWPSDKGTTTSVASHAGPSTQTPGTAANQIAPPIDPAALANPEAYYRPVVELDPFRERAFHPPRPRKTGSGTTTDDAPPTPAAPTSGSTSAQPEKLALRLTGVFAVDSGVTALLEDRISGKGLFVKVGDKLGDRSIARIDTMSIVMAPPGGVSPVATGSQVVVALGDKLEVLPKDLENRLATLGPATTPPPSSGGTDEEQAPPMAEDKRQAILEALKKRRESELKAAGGKP